MAEVSCAECGAGLGLWYPGPPPEEVYCKDCHDQAVGDLEACEAERENLEEIEKENEHLERQVQDLEAELQGAQAEAAERAEEEPVPAE